MKRVTVWVTETIEHKIQLDVSYDEAQQMEEDLSDPSVRDDVAGDLASRSTISDGSYDLEDYEIKDINDER